MDSESWRPLVGIGGENFEERQSQDFAVETMLGIRVTRENIRRSQDESETVV